MTSRLVAVWICALLTMVPPEATADWIVRPFLGAAVSPRHGFVDLEQTSGDSRLVLGAAAGWQRRAIGVEVELSVLPGFFDGSGDLVVAGHVITVVGNVTWQLPTPHESSRLRAYVAGGAGIVRIRLERCARRVFVHALAGGRERRRRGTPSIAATARRQHRRAVLQDAVWRCGPSRVQ